MMRVVELENIKIPSLNNKYGMNKYTGQLFLTKEYREFKKLIESNCIPCDVRPPYYVYIEVTGYNDIDNAIKPILDGIEGKAIDNDKNVLRLVVEKIPTTKKSMNKIIVEVSEL